MTFLTGPFLIYRVAGYISLIPSFVESPFFNANSVDPDQKPRSAASDLGLYCLPLSLLWDAKLKWVKLSKFGGDWLKTAIHFFLFTKSTT